MAIKIVREPSTTPNITSMDDFIGLRYAYGDQNGYVSKRGSELGYEISGSSFKVLSGRLVIQGVECDIDANGISILIDNVSILRYHTVYAQVSLANMTVQILETYDTAGYPDVSVGDDLFVNTTGTARLPLYRFTSTQGAISSVEKVVIPVAYIGRPKVTEDNVERNIVLVGPDGRLYVSRWLTCVPGGPTPHLKLLDASGSPGSCRLYIGDDVFFTDVDIAGNVALRSAQNPDLIGTIHANVEGTATTARYASTDHTKGTIEERLTRLGFKQGSVAGVVATQIGKLVHGIIPDGTLLSNLKNQRIPNIEEGTSVTFYGCAWAYSGSGGEYLVNVEYQIQNATFVSIKTRRSKSEAWSSSLPIQATTMGNTHFGYSWY